MIDYNPVGAVAALAGRRNFVETVNTGTGPGGLNAPNIGSPDTAGEGERDAPGTIPAPQQGGTAPNQGLVNYQIDQDQAGTNVGSGTIDPATGQVTGQTASDMPGVPKNVRVSPQQKIQLDNFKATGVTGDAYTSGIRKILGLPEPMVDYTAPDGTKLQLPASQVAQYKARDAALKQANANKTAAQKALDDSRQANLQFKYDNMDTVHQDKTSQLDLDYKKLTAQQESQLASITDKDQRAAAQRQMQQQNKGDFLDRDTADKQVAVDKEALAQYMKLHPLNGDSPPDPKTIQALEAKTIDSMNAAVQIRQGQHQRIAQSLAPATPNNQTGASGNGSATGAAAPRPDKTPDGKSIIYGDGGGYLTDGTHYSNPDGSLLSASGKALPAAIGKPLAGSTVVNTGTLPDGTRVVQLKDGRMVDETGKPLQ